MPSPLKREVSGLDNKHFLDVLMPAPATEEVGNKHFLDVLMHALGAYEVGKRSEQQFVLDVLMHALATEEVGNMSGQHVFFLVCSCMP
jgi:hypothetical protein